MDQRSNVIAEVLRSWLQKRWPQYATTKQIEGTYGLVFVLESTQTNVFPRKWCIKTVNPAKISLSGRDLEKLFEREMRLWLNIPSHYNVLPALGLDLAPSPEEFATEFKVFPLVRMPFCHSILSRWVEDQTAVTNVDRLIVLAQLCSGLQGKEKGSSPLLAIDTRFAMK